jgi:Flp pilus assembly secretin CpaC
MTALAKRNKRVFCRVVVISLIAMMGINGAGHAAGDNLTVVLDQAKLVKLPERVTTIIIGNPLIADVSLQSGGLMVVTGKSYGKTNLIALDRAGATLLEKSIEVRAPRDGIVVVYRGMERESYSCIPLCERRNTLGDTSSFFETTLAQSVGRSGQAQGSPPPASK